MDEGFGNAPADGRLHDLKTIARWLDVSIKSVRRLINQGELGYHQVGRLKRGERDGPPIGCCSTA